MRNNKKNPVIIFSILIVFTSALSFALWIKQSFKNKSFETNETELLMPIDKSNAYNSDWLTTRELKTLCGINCLFLISEYYDLKIPYEDLKFLLEPGSSGTSMKRLKDVAENLGYTVKAQKTNLRDLYKHDCPFIMFVPKGDKETLYGHYIVGLPLPSVGGVAFYDPPRKVINMTRSEFEGKPNTSFIILSLYYEKNFKDQGNQYISG